MRTGYKLSPGPGPAGHPRPGDRAPLDERASSAFPASTLAGRLARELARERALPVKELYESLEFFARVRKLVRGPRVADLCCGHGLTGILFALFERSVERVVLLDRSLPPNHERVRAAARRVGPWVEEKLEVREGRVKHGAQALEPGTSIVAVHACGLRTDQCLEAAVRLRSPVAVMPCCYPEAHCPAPPTLVQHLGLERAFDVDRTYRLERAGYRVRWDAIPPEITPMGRILVGLPRAAPAPGVGDGPARAGLQESAGSVDGPPAHRGSGGRSWQHATT